MTDAQVRTLLPDLLERAAIEDHLADGCNDGSPLEREHLAWAQSLRAIAAHLEAAFADRAQAEQDREDAERFRYLCALWARPGGVGLFPGHHPANYVLACASAWIECDTPDAAIDAAREASRDD